MDSNLYSIGEVSRSLGCSEDTIRRYESKGIVKPYRNRHGKRFYSQTDIQKIIDALGPVRISAIIPGVMAEIAERAAKVQAADV